MRGKLQQPADAHLMYGDFESLADNQGYTRQSLVALDSRYVAHADARIRTAEIADGYYAELHSRRRRYELPDVSREVRQAACLRGVIQMQIPTRQTRIDDLVANAHTHLEEPSHNPIGIAPH
jgi:hypothetical protein